MNKTNMALLGFVSSAADYLNDRITAEGDEIKELTDINFDDLKKELLAEMSSSFSGGNNDAIDAGRRVFARMFKEEKKTPLMNEFDDLFNVDFGNDRKDKEIQDHLLSLLKEPGSDSPEYDIISSAAENSDEKKETVRIPADSEKIDNLFSQILDSENRRQESSDLSEYDDEPEDFEEKLETEREIDQELDLRPLSERLRSYSEVNEDFSEEELDRLYGQLDLSDIKKEREEHLRESDANKSLSKRLKDTKNIDREEREEPYVSELPKIEEAPVQAKGRYHQTLSDLLREVKESSVSAANVPAEAPVEVPVETVFEKPAEEVPETAELEEENNAGSGFDSPVFGNNYLSEEESEETLPHDPIEDLYIPNPASEDVKIEGIAELEEKEEEETAPSEEETVTESEEEPLNEVIEDADTPEDEDIDYMGELINGLNTDTIAQRIENVRKEEEDAKNAVYESIKGIYPYLSDSFIRGVYDLKGSLGYDYPEDEEIIILHRLHFKDVEGLRNFVEVILSHEYAVNVDEKQMIVDVFKNHINTDGRILTDIFEIANQAKLLDGDYEGYKIIENNEVDF